MLKAYKGFNATKVLLAIDELQVVFGMNKHKLLPLAEAMSRIMLIAALDEDYIDSFRLFTRKRLLAKPII